MHCRNTRPSRPTWRSPRWLKTALSSAAFALLGTTMMAQTVIIGTNSGANTTTTYPCPIGDYYTSQRAQYLYTSAELSAAGITSGSVITNLGWVVNATTISGCTLPGYTISMKNTTTTTLNTAAAWETGASVQYGPTSYTYPSGYAGNVMFPVGSFVYNGTNLLVEVCHTFATTSDYTSNPQVQWTTGLAFNGNHTFRNDNVPGCGTATVTQTGTATTRPRLVITYTGGSACSGTPAPGNTLSSVVNACNGVAFTLSLQNSTSGSGVTYQWQSADNAAFTVGLTNMGTSSTQSATQSSAKYYRCNVTCSAGPSTGTSNPVLVGMNNFLSCYCIPTTTNGCGSGDQITNVTFTSASSPINNTTGACISGGSYSDYTSTVPTAGVTQNDVVSVSVAVNNGGTEYAAGWIDYDHSGIFDAGEFISLVDADGVAPWVYNGTVTIPLTAQTGVTGLRFRSSYAATIASNSSCATYSYGETEDYRVNISANTGCTSATAGTITGTATACAGATNVLSLSGSATGTGLTYQWAYGVPGGPYTNLLGTATTQSTAPIPAGTWEVVCTVTCANCGPCSGTTAPFAVTINPSPGGSISGPTSGGTYTNLTYTASGFTGSPTFQWQTATAIGGPYTNVGGNVNPIALSSNAAGTFYVRCLLTASGCTTTSNVITVVITVANDNVCSALPLIVGNNGPYTNAGATFQPGEGAPVNGSCTGQTSWCSAADQTVWFTFVAPSTGRISLNFGTTQNWDSEIALWSAPNCAALTSGGGTLLAANDDITGVSPYHAAITPICVTPGVTYYVQVDGYSTTTNTAFMLQLVSEPAAVTASIGGTTTVCPGGNANITFTGTSGATVNYSVNNGPSQNGVMAGGSLVVNTGAVSSTTVYELLSVMNGTCTQTFTGQTATVTVPTLDDGDPCTLDACAGGVVTHTYQDSDGDGICDANDPCPNLAFLQNGDPCDDGNVCTINDVVAGCVCAGTFQDSDADGTCDANDGCPNDANKIAPGQCGCGVADTDADSDGTADCNDGCPNDPTKIAPGICGCGVSDADSDGDGIADCNDNCPSLFGQQGDACDDGNACTTGDVINAACVCAGSGQDADNDGICDASDNCPFLFGQQGDACNDGDACTINDVITNACVCAGTYSGDTDGDGVCDSVDNCPTLFGQQGDACDDGDACTINDVISGACICAGTFADADADGICDANDNCPNLFGQQGDACDDGSACTINDVITAGCVCAGTFQDTDGDGICDANDNCPTLFGQQGDACNDGDACTTGDVITAGCVCAGTPSGDTDGDGICNATDNCPTLFGQQGDACNDGNPGTINDVITNACVCAGTPAGCLSNEVTLVLNTDASASQTTWDIVIGGTNTVVCGGGGYANNSTITVSCCLPNGCYDLRVHDSFGDGINPGGFLLKDASNRAIVNNVGNGPNFTTLSMVRDASNVAQSFCVPLSNDGLGTGCGNEALTATSVIQATPNAAVTSAYSAGNSTTGYQFWFFTPNGGYSRKIFQSHASPGNAYPPATPNGQRCSYLKLNAINTNPLPSYTLLNVRVRTQVNGVYGAYGPACRIKIDPTAGCQTTQLTTVGFPVNPAVSCGATVNRNGGIIYADVVSGANKYQFQFTRPGYTRNIASSTRSLTLANWATNPLQCGLTYDVKVRASFDDGTTYCAYGAVCQITTTCSSSFGGGTNRDMEVETVVEMQPLQVWPNPNDGDQLYLSLEGIDPTIEIATVDITDLFGRRVYTHTLNVNDGRLNEQLELKNALANGVYVLTLTTGERVSTERIVIQ